MSDMTILILAAGNAVRFGGTRKQLLPLDKDYTILERITTQCTIMNHVPIVVAKDYEIQAAALEYQVLAYQPVRHNVTCETLEYTAPLWNRRTVVLLGDVIYSPYAIRTILAYDGYFAVFGNSFEVFGLSFDAVDQNKLIDTLRIAKQFGLGKLRYAYKQFMGIPMDSEETEGTPPGANFLWFNDWTRDVDMQSEYDDTVKQLVNTNKLERLV